MARVLFVDDDLKLQRAVEIFLNNKGHEVFKASNGNQALELEAVLKPEVLILDIMMPELDGFEACKIIKARSSVPIIILTAMSKEDDRVKGFKLGADDYITKPFSLKELGLRIDVLLRRFEKQPTSTSNERLVYRGITIDRQQKSVILNDKSIQLTKIEFQLLWLLACNPNQLFTHSELIDAVWEQNNKGSRNALHVYIRRLRSKINGDQGNINYLQNIWGQGYIFKV